MSLSASSLRWGRGGETDLTERANWYYQFGPVHVRDAGRREAEALPLAVLAGLKHHHVILYHPSHREGVGEVEEPLAVFTKVSSLTSRYIGL